MDLDFIFTLHSHMRYLVLTTAGLAIMGLVYGMFSGRGAGGIVKIFVKVYAWVLSIQFLIGIVQLALRWEYYEGDNLRNKLEHAGLMFLAVGAAHMTNRFYRKSPLTATRPVLALVAGSLLLILLGILMLPQGAYLLGLFRIQE